MGVPAEIQLFQLKGLVLNFYYHIRYNSFLYEFYNIDNLACWTDFIHIAKSSTKSINSFDMYQWFILCQFNILQMHDQFPQGSMQLPDLGLSIYRLQRIWQSIWQLQNFSCTACLKEPNCWLTLTPSSLKVILGLCGTQNVHEHVHIHRVPYISWGFSCIVIWDIHVCIIKVAIERTGNYLMCLMKYSQLY